MRVLPVPVAASVTKAPLTGFPLASFAVTVIVAVWPFRMVVGEAVTVESDPDTPPGASWHVPLPASVNVSPRIG